METESTAVKNLMNAYKQQTDMIAKLTSDLKQKPYFRVVADSLEILKDIGTRKAAKLKDEHDFLLEKIVNPLANRLLANEDNLSKIALGEKNFHSWIELSKAVNEKFNKMYTAGQQYDLVFEDEQVKQQLKTPTFKISKISSSKAQKSYDKLKEEEKLYKFAIENYNRHTSTLMNENVG